MERHMIGQLFGNYRLTRLLGEGGFATVYLGEHLHLGTQAAIKVLHTRLTSTDLTYFLTEARTVARFVHPHIVRILDFGVEQGIPYLVMDFASNGSLRLRYSKGAVLPLSTVVSYVKQISEALQYAHDQRLIHRDVKPENMLIMQNSEIVLSDFGIAVIAQSSHSLDTMEAAGTISYMAPEQLQGKPVPASDQYALSIVAYEWLCGERPFNGSTMEIATQHMLVPPPALREKVPAISPEVERVVLRALSKDPKQRFSSILEYAMALEQAAIAIPTLEGTMKTGPRPVAEVSAGVRQPEIQEKDDAFGTLQNKRLQFRGLRDHIRGLFRKPQQSPARPTSPFSSDKPPTALPPDSAVSEAAFKDFFISYSRADRSWAKWIKWQLDKVGYSTVLLPWGVRSDFSFEMEIQEAVAHAKRIIIVLSLSYFNMLGNQTIWIDIFKQKVTEEKDKLLIVCVRECEHEFRKLLESINYIDLSTEDETSAQAMLLADVHGKGIELTIQPAFPGEIGDKSPTFPGKVPVSPSRLESSNPRISSPSITTSASLIQQAHIAFTRKDWPDVIRKVDYLLKLVPDSLSSEIYRMQGQAFLESGDKQRASESLHTALALATESSQRLMLLEEYTSILVSLNRWSEVLGATREALRLSPNDTTWLTLQQQSLTQLKTTDKEPPQVRPQPKSYFTSSVSPGKSLEVFFSYSHKDEEMRFELEKYLSNLKRQRSISGWYDGEIGAGNEWAKEIDTHLSQADIILLLVSQDFIASDYCYDVEMMRALERHRTGLACVVPIILRPAHWEVTHFGKLQALPTGGKPITLWPNHDEAFLNVARGIQKVVDRLTRNGSYG